MTHFKLIIQSFRHYFWSHVALMMGIAISTMVIVGALIVGDSVTHSLERIAELRLGNTNKTLTASNRYFTTSLANNLQGVPLLKLNGTAVYKGQSRLNKVQILGVNVNFKTITNANFTDSLKNNQVAVSRNLASRLNLNVGDAFLLRVEKASLTPRNAPFVSEEAPTVAIRVVVNAILNENQLGAFNLQNSQTAPFNVFMNLSFLQERVELKNRINYALFVPEQNPQYELSKYFSLADAGLSLQTDSKQNYINLSSDNVFISNKLADIFPKSDKYLSYFVNEIKHKHKTTPYSFVSTLADKTLSENEVIVNSWLAEDLELAIGDSLWLTYFIIGPLRELSVDSSEFIVKDIVPIEGIYADRSLAPNIPGLSDAGNCRDWEAGVPVKLDAIRDKDEQYWNAYKGTPKAFINLQKAQSLWENRFGSLTLLRFKNVQEAQLEDDFKNHINPYALGFKLSNVKQEALFAARNGVDFGQLFIGLSFFILVSGIVLIVLLLSYHVQKRETQMGTLSALGFSAKKIRWLLIGETSLVAVLGVGLGIWASIIYNRFIFIALNRVWNAIVRTQMLEVDIQPLTVLFGGSIALVLVMGTIYFAIKRATSRQINEQQRSIKPLKKLHLQHQSMVFAWIFFAMLSAVLVFLMIAGKTTSTGLFFMLGVLVLFNGIWFFRLGLSPKKHCSTKFQHFWQLGFKNMTQNKRRSHSIVILFALGVFMVVSTGLNRKDLTRNASDKASGTGGFLFFAETTLPILKNLNSPLVQHEEGLREATRFVQFRKAEGDDASCLNLNKITNPAILGVDAEALESRFAFATSISKLDVQDLWRTLKQQRSNNVIPAIADQTVIQWGLGLSVGDTLIYDTESGKQLKLLLVGGLANSIFQGYVIIDNSYFLEYFPTSSGSNLLLISGAPENSKAIEEELSNTFRDYGIQLTSTANKLLEFYSVENTYLNIFLFLGLLGLILGILGLGIVLAKSVMERRSEIALYQSVGFSRINIMGILIFEYAFLLTVGVGIGVLSSVIATLPSLLSSGTEVSIVNAVQVLGFLMLSGVLIIMSFAFGLVYGNTSISVGLKSD